MSKIFKNRKLVLITLIIILFMLNIMLFSFLILKSPKLVIEASTLRLNKKNNFSLIYVYVNNPTKNTLHVDHISMNLVTYEDNQIVDTLNVNLSKKWAIDANRTWNEKIDPYSKSLITFFTISPSSISVSKKIVLDIKVLTKENIVLSSSITIFVSEF